MMRGFNLLLIVLLLSGCSMLAFPKLNAPEPPQTVYTYNETFEKNPTAVAIGDKIVVVEQQSRTVTAGYKMQEKKLGFWKRMMNWIAGWGILTIVVVLVSMSFGITAPFMFLLARFRQLKKTSSDIIKIIDKEDVIKNNPMLGVALSSNLDKKQKILIDDLKRS